MIFGIILGLAWLSLVLRYPSRALPVSAAAMSCFALLLGWILWQDMRTERLQSQVQTHIEFNPSQCPSERPLRLSINNGSSANLQRFEFNLVATTQSLSANLLSEQPYQIQHTSPLLAGQNHVSCLVLPALRPGYRAATLTFKAEQIRGSFSN